MFYGGSASPYRENGPPRVPRSPVHARNAIVNSIAHDGARFLMLLTRCCDLGSGAAVVIASGLACAAQSVGVGRVQITAHPADASQLWRVGVLCRAGEGQRAPGAQVGRARRRAQAWGVANNRSMPTYQNWSAARCRCFRPAAGGRPRLGHGFDNNVGWEKRRCMIAVGMAASVVSA